MFTEMDLLPTINGTGWPFMQAGLMFWITVSLLPFAVRMWREKRPYHRSVIVMLEEESDLRMVVGYMLTAAAIMGFSCVGWVRSLMIEAGEFGDLSLFQRLARYYFMTPLTLMVIVGAAMILWDFAAKWGRIACVVLTLVAVVFYFVGEYADDLVIERVWGVKHGGLPQG